MIKTLMFASVIALSTAAVAQEQTAPAPQPAPVETATPQDAAPMPESTADTQGMTGDATAQAEPQTAQPSTAQAQPQAAQPTDVASIVAAEFPTYDGNGDGQLTKPEFSKWLITLRTKSAPAGQPAPSEQELQSWAGAAFAQADTDKSTAVSQAELTTFLQG